MSTVSHQLGFEFFLASPLLTIDKTLVVEVVIEAAPQRRRGPARRGTGVDRWREWQRLLDEGVYGSKGAGASGWGVAGGGHEGLRLLNSWQVLVAREGHSIL